MVSGAPDKLPHAGTRSGCPNHFIRFDAGAKSVLIVEGILKAEIVAEWSHLVGLNCPIVACVGTGTFGDIGRQLKGLMPGDQILPVILFHGAPEAFLAVLVTLPSRDPQSLGDFRGRPVAVLASGDPFHYGVGDMLMRSFAVEETICLPQPSSFSLAASRLGWSLQDVTPVSLHGRALEHVVRHLQPGARLLALSWDGGCAVVALSGAKAS